MIVFVVVGVVLVAYTVWAHRHPDDLHEAPDVSTGISEQEWQHAIR